MAVEEEEARAFGSGLSRHLSTLVGAPDNRRGSPHGKMVAMSEEYDVAEFMAGMPQGMGALNEKMGIEIVEISPERVVATMPVEGNTQPYGLLHGGASVVLAETLGSIGSALHAMPEKLSVGVDINATHHRSATSGVVTGTATAIHLGRSSASYEVVVTNEAGKRVCTARITCALMPAEKYS